MFGAAAAVVWQALGLRGILIIGAMLAVVAAYFVVLDRGGDIALQRVEQQNQKAEDGKARARTRVDRCFLDGGEWSNVTGSCVMPPVVREPAVEQPTVRDDPAPLVRPAPRGRP